MKLKHKPQRLFALRKKSNKVHSFMMKHEYNILLSNLSQTSLRQVAEALLHTPTH